MSKVKECKRKGEKRDFAKRHWCEDCNSEYQREYRLRNKDKIWNLIKKWRRENRSEHLEIQRKSQIRYVFRNPEKIRAHDAVKNNRGKFRKSVCEFCNGKENLELHHPDYSKPLAVITLCRGCHRKETYASQ